MHQLFVLIGHLLNILLHGAVPISEIVCRDQGVGLAAPQVGVNVRLMVYNPEGEKGKGQEWILVNPRVVSSGKGQDIMEEGCLSFQDLSKDMHIKGRVIVSPWYLHLTRCHALAAKIHAAHAGWD